ncbi:MAG: exo-alpha-sialidase [Lentisphaerae bacterium]|nr:exo-alpha-sialidase [Lentisphaerota bacterium]
MSNPGEHPVDLVALEEKWARWVAGCPACEKPVRYLLDEAKRFTEQNHPEIVAHDVAELDVLRAWAERDAFRNPSPAALAQPRGSGEKVVLRVYGSPDDYASFPRLVRTANGRVILPFHVQPVPILRGWRLRDWHWHPHGQQFSTRCWAISDDRGATWRITREEPAIEDIVYAARSPLALAGPEAEAHLARDIGDRNAFYVFDYTRCGDDSLLAAGRPVPGSVLAGAYGPPPGADVPTEKAHDHTTCLFARSTDGGETWEPLSHMVNSHRWSYTEPSLYVRRDGSIVCMIRSEWRETEPEKIEPEAGNKHDAARDGREPGYGWYFHQSESTDDGLTWSDPVRTPVWGHPANLIRLQSGNVLMVYGHRRHPWTVRAILSRDDARTWDMDSMRVLHTFDPGLTDFGYPVATQFANGTILCVFYGYATEEVDPWGTPHAVYAALFDEEWLGKAAPSARL